MRIGQAGSNFYAMTAPLRDALADVQSQLSTSQKANSYGLMPTGTQAWLDFSASASKAQSLIEGIERHQLRLKMVDQTLTGLGRVVETTRSHLVGGLTAFQAGQSTASNALGMVTDLLNSKNGSVPLFAGNALSGDAVLNADALLNGDGVQPGLRMLIAERVAADTGGGTLGRLALNSATSHLTLAEQGGVFGFQIKGGSASRADIAISYHDGPPSSLNVASTASLQEGDQISLQLGLPYGEDVTLTLRAGQDFPAGPFNGSAIEQALNAKLSALTPRLKTASAMRVTQDYFAGQVTRVNEVPAQQGLTLQAPLLVSWYVGQAHTNPRQSVQIIAGAGEPLAAGVQANEDAFTSLLAPLAAMAVLMEDPTMVSQDGQTAMQTYLAPSLHDRSLLTLQTGFGLIDNQLSTAKDVQTSAKRIAEEFLAESNHVDMTEAAAQLLSLQNQLQASYQAGVNILRLSLVNYL